MKYITEFDVRQIDEHGDVCDLDHFDTEASAKHFASRLSLDSRCCAIVVEQHRFVVDNRSIRDSVYVKLLTTGSETALRAGGWID